MVLAVLLFLFLFHSTQVQAVNEFTVQETITYTLDSTGDAKVDQQLSLTNNYSNIYAKEYVVSLSGNDLSQITGHDDGGPIIQKIDTAGDHTSINVKFNNPAVGKDKTKTFYLNYFITNLAATKGKLKEIALPQYNTLGTDDQILITLKVPTTYGNLSFSSLAPVNQSQADSYRLLNYKITSANSASKIVLAFGNSQLFDFNLTYHITNPEATDALIQIPIPPDTPNQTIIYKSFSLPPENILTNEDGNWLAQFRLTANQDVTLVVSGQAKILPLAKTSPSLGDKYHSQLLSDSTFWHPSSSDIKTIAATLHTPKQIYDYVVTTLSYTTDLNSTPHRKGDLAALANPEASLCTEFTDLFVSLARAAGIPAREIEGYAYSNNDKIKPVNSQADILHAWPQYWDDKKGWLSVDPTWGKTTNGVDFFNDLDLNHFAFVIHGQNADTPPAPGSYRQAADTKTVDVTFASAEENNSLEPIRLTLDKSSHQIKATNPNSQAVYNLVLSDPEHHWQHTLALMPPLSSQIIDVPKLSFITSLLPHNQKLHLTSTFDGSQTCQHSLLYLPHFLNLAIVICLCILVLALGGIIITKSKQ